MSITAPLEKRTPASRLFAAYTLVIALVGVGLLYLGATRMALGGGFLYPALGLALVVAGVQLFRRKRSGLWMFALSLLGTWIWELIAGVAPASSAPMQPANTLPAWLHALPESILLPIVAAAMGLIMLAFWPIVRKRLVGVAKPGYFIINGVLPLAILITTAVTRL